MEQQPIQQQGRAPLSSSLEQLQQWQQQMTGLEQRYNQISGNNYRWQSSSETAQGPGVPPLAQASQSVGGLQQMANQLAERYGIAGRAPIVDAAGNFTRMPEGAEEAVKFQYIAQALANYQSEQVQKRAEAAQAAGIGLVQQRGRGSLATLQQGAYSSLAQTIQADKDRISEMQPDFSYFIEKEMQERQEALMREWMSFQKKQAKYGMIGGIVGGLTGLGLGFAGGNPMGGAGAGMQMGQSMGAGMAYY